MSLAVLIAIFLPFIASPFLAFGGRMFGARVGYAAVMIPVVSVTSVILVGLKAGSSPHHIVEFPWVPSLGLNLSFLVDGLSLTFGGIVSGVGVLVFWYASQYFTVKDKNMGRFYAYLSLFMGSMLGNVFSNNLLLLFVFWELTGVSSFLLIGFLHEKEGSRRGARMALLVTGLTGLIMLVGFVMVQMKTGTYQISQLLSMNMAFDEHKTWFNVALILMMIGAFGKSAQFPMQFWLPNAMAAPTPVSAYLHSATMVKLGVFLSARLFPIFSEMDLWFPLLSAVGFVTMGVASFLALRSNDLKAILAYSTVTQLGLLIGFYGVWSITGVRADFFHIWDHVFYKACLFMIAGVVMHCTGLRDIRELGGLVKQMPWIAVACVIASASMAGVPLTMGFVSKEMLLADLVVLWKEHKEYGSFLLAIFLMASVFKVAFAVRLVMHVFFGSQPEAVRAHFHAPSLLFQLSPLVLASLSFLSGLFPFLWDPFLEALRVHMLQSPQEIHLAIWHGFNVELGLSVSVLILGLILYGIGEKAQWRWTFIPRVLQFDRVFENGLSQLGQFSKKLNQFLSSDRPFNYLPVVMTAVVLIVGGNLAYHLKEQSNSIFEYGQWQFELDFLRCFVAFMIIAASVGVILLRRWTTQLISLSTAGFLTTFYFVLYRAPDLALTQILVEAASLVMVLVLLSRFPKSAEEGERADFIFDIRQKISVLISLSVGVMITGLILVTTVERSHNLLGDFYLDATLPLAKGTNAVNTILVDFRGFDTLGEISVLLIAILGGVGLLMRRKRTEEERNLEGYKFPGLDFVEGTEGKGKKGVDDEES